MPKIKPKLSRRKKLETKTVALIKKLHETELVVIAEFAEYLGSKSTVSESRLNQLASEQALAKDWLTQQEDKAWAHL